MMRMLLVGYIMGIRSERRLCDSVLLRHVFETVFAQCIEAGLVSDMRRMQVLLLSMQTAKIHAKGRLEA